MKNTQSKNQSDGRSYLPNGKPVYKQRTIEEKQMYCRTFSHYGIRSDLLWGKIFEWGCHTPGCPKCEENRQGWRIRKLYGRLKETGSDTFYTKTISDDESRSVRRTLRNKGTEFISIPVPQGKLIIIDNFLDGFEPIEKNNMLKIVSNLSIASGKESRISGKLGLVEKKNKVLIPICTRGIGRIESSNILSDSMFDRVSILAMISVGGIGSSKITPDMLQTLVTARENKTVDLLKRMNYSVYLQKEKEIMVDPDVIKDRWIEIEVNITSRGDMSLLNNYGRSVIADTVDKLSDVADNPIDLFRDAINAMPVAEAVSLMDEFDSLGVELQ